MQIWHLNRLSSTFEQTQTQGRIVTIRSKTSRFEENRRFIQLDVTGRYYHFTEYKNRSESPALIAPPPRKSTMFLEAKKSTSTKNYSTLAKFSSLFHQICLFWKLRNLQGVPLFVPPPICVLPLFVSCQISEANWFCPARVTLGPHGQPSIQLCWDPGISPRTPWTQISISETSCVIIFSCCCYWNN